MTSPPPVWLLDVDGVLNASKPGWGGPPRKTNVAGLTIRWAPPLVARIRTLHASGVVEVRWSTTWCGYPDQLADLGTLFHLDLESAFGDRPMSKTWADLKVEAAMGVLTEGRRLVGPTTTRSTPPGACSRNWPPPKRLGLRC